MWKVCDCKDHSLPLSISVSVSDSDCGEFKPPLEAFPSVSPPLHLLLFSVSVSTQVGLQRSGKFLRIAGNLDLQSRLHTNRTKRNQPTRQTWARVYR